MAVKPLETGCLGPPAETEDGVALARATGQVGPLHALSRFRDPVAPPEAADREGRQIDFEALVHQIREHAARADVSLVEGAGGLLSPLTWERNAMDLARALEARVLLVAADRLGTINHTLMAFRILSLVRLDVLGVVLTAPGRPDSSTGSNAVAISRLSGLSRVLCAPRVEDPEVSSDCVQEVIEWLQLT